MDASVKIYSHRVDDTHASSKEILESLSSAYTTENATEGHEKGTAKVGGKSGKFVTDKFIR